jgi:16S rRNA (cytosine1402-N4)-methyltransferase
MPYHVPVLLDAVLSGLEPGPGQVFVDATIGGANHAAAIAQRLGPEGALIGLDQDPDAIAEAQARFAELKSSADAQAALARLKAASSLVRLSSAADLGYQFSLPRVMLFRARFDRIGALLDESGYPTVDGILFDLGVSGHQLDDQSRGFTFRERDTLLDMRMDPQAGTPTAADLLNSLPEKELADLFKRNAEEPWSARIAQFVCLRRKNEPYKVAGQLVDTVLAAIPAAARSKGIHPATRVFQALRIEVNDELSILPSALAQAIDRLRPGGRIAVISFHSLEDRLVKRLFASRSGRCQCPPSRPVCDCGAAQPDLVLRTKKPITPSAEEIAQNPRSRSAKLRIAQKAA